jgi:hypothetical protein
MHTLSAAVADQISGALPSPGREAAIASVPAVPEKSAASIAVGTLFGDPAISRAADAAFEFLSGLGKSLDRCALSASLARAGTVGRIGVPPEACSAMSAQRVMIAATFGSNPLSPIPRLWRGMQRVAGVLVDVRQCTTLPGSAAASAGFQRDVLLVSHRLRERVADAASAAAFSTDRWSRARDAAELVYRLAAAERRTVLLVLPVGRATVSQRLFADALERQARALRLPSARSVKAGLLAALLSGEGGSERWLVASVMRMDELSALTTEAIGDAGPWPVMSIGRDSTFFDMPASTDNTDHAVPLLLVVLYLLQQHGDPTRASALFRALLMTQTAAARMREELGTDLTIPVDAFLSGVLANWGRSPLDARTVGNYPNSRVRAARAMAVTAGCSILRSAEMA